MIRINLLKDIVGGVQAVGGAPGEAAAAGGPDNKDAVKKLIIIAVFPILLMGVFSYFEYEEEQKISAVKKQIQNLKTQVQNLQPQIRAVKNFQEEKKKLEVQVEAIKQLSRERLVNVKALATLQSIIPKQVWLLSLSIRGGKLQIKGQASSDKFITTFLSKLNQSIYFRNTRLKGTKEATSKEVGVVKEFEFESTLAVGS